MKHENLPQRIISTFKDLFPTYNNRIALHEPAFIGHEWDYVKECLDTGWVSSVGSYVDRFEKDLAVFVGAPYAVAVVNGTAALHISLLIAGVQPDSEVLIPSLTFIATANAVSYCGAIPHFVDASEDTLGIDPTKLASYLSQIVTFQKDRSPYNKKTGRKISAIVPMHTFGHPLEIEQLLTVCDKYRIPVVEDAAESLGSFYKGKHTGNFGAISALSFNGNKIVTTGGGGAIFTANPEWAAKAKHLSTTGKQPHPFLFNHDEIAYNYRMPNINAALGCAQLEQLPLFLSKKRNLAEIYKEVFGNFSGVSFIKEPQLTTSNYWLNALKLDEPNIELRDQILRMSNAEGIMMRPIWTPIHKLIMYKDCPKMDLTTTEDLEARIINIPSSANLIDYIEKA
jgi:perosamine synthetase